MRFAFFLSAALLVSGIRLHDEDMTDEDVPQRITNGDKSSVDLKIEPTKEEAINAKKLDESRRPEDQASRDFEAMMAKMHARDMADALKAKHADMKKKGIAKG